MRVPKTDHNYLSSSCLPDSRIQCKLASLCYNCLNSTTAGYQTEHLTQPTRQLRSSSNTSILCLPSVCTHSLERFFCVCVCVSLMMLRHRTTTSPTCNFHAHCPTYAHTFLRNSYRHQDFLLFLMLCCLPGTVSLAKSGHQHSKHMKG